MEDTLASKPKKSSTQLAYVIVASFLLGSFSGAAFGVLFAVSLNEKYYPWRTLPDAATVAARQALTNEDQQVIEAVRKASPSVVSVVVLRDVSKLYNRTGVLPSDYFGYVPGDRMLAKPGEKQEVGGGTGFVISADGLILTNRHVTDDLEAEYQVVMSDGKTYPAKVLARDSILDVAVLKIEATELAVPTLGDSDQLSAGETVIAIGNALSEYRNTVTKGVISGINRRVIAGNEMGVSEVLEEALQTDAAINPGNSGGPLIDLRGNVIGMNTAVNRSGQSISFAIPINAIKVVIESVKTHGKIVRPWLGVRYVMLTTETAKAQGLDVDHGAVVTGAAQGRDAAVVADSPAARADIRPGDVLLEIDGARLDEQHPLSTIIAKKRAGETIRILLLREKAERVVTVVLGVLPDMAP